MTNLLIIDDDEELSDMLGEYLQPEGFTVSTALRGDEGAELALAKPWDAIVLDIMLPGMNGLEVLRTVRSRTQTPILMLTAKGDDVDRILGLEMGADDYLPKPFNPRELVARLRAILRRQTPSGETATLTCRSLTMMPGSRRAVVFERELNLTSTEYNVLEVLMRHSGQVVGKGQLYELALGRPIAAYDRSIDMHISHLRRKLGELDEHLVIHTVRGAGYQLEK
jgi:DNA-binding response OmpR family regulator